MHAAVKLIIGLLILIAGLYWYVAPIFHGGQNGVATFLGVASTFQSFLVVFAGLFGLLLVVLGAIIAWIEYEDLKWERREKAEATKTKKKGK